MRARSTRWATFIALALLGAVALPGLAGPAQAAPAAAPALPAACGNDYPPHGPAIEPRLVVTEGLLVPGSASGTIVLGGAVPGGDYEGTLFSRVVDLPRTSATGAGVVRFTGLAIPADFRLDTVHHLDVRRGCDLVGAFDFCVAANGHVAPAASCHGVVAAASGHASGSLPRTGWDHLFELLRLAALLLGTGTLLLYLRRRRAAAAA